MSPRWSTWRLAVSAVRHFDYVQIPHTRQKASELVFTLALSSFSLLSAQPFIIFQFSVEYWIATSGIPPRNDVDALLITNYDYTLVLKLYNVWSSESSMKLASTLPSRDKHLSFLNVWLSERKQLRFRFLSFIFSFQFSILEVSCFLFPVSGFGICNSCRQD